MFFVFIFQANTFFNSISSSLTDMKKQIMNLERSLGKLQRFNDGKQNTELEWRMELTTNQGVRNTTQTACVHLYVMVLRAQQMILVYMFLFIQSWFLYWYGAIYVCEKGIEIV